MCLLPAAIIFVGLMAVATADEFRTGRETSDGVIQLIIFTTIVFVILGVIFR